MMNTSKLRSFLNGIPIVFVNWLIPLLPADTSPVAKLQKDDDEPATERYPDTGQLLRLRRMLENYRMRHEKILRTNVVLTPSISAKRVRCGCQLAGTAQEHRGMELQNNCPNMLIVEDLGRLV
jgi:hypothetical protein